MLFAIFQVGIEGDYWVLVAITGDYSSLLHTWKLFIKFGLFLSRKVTC